LPDLIRTIRRQACDALEAAREPLSCTLSGAADRAGPDRFLILGIVASQVGDMRGDIRLAPAILFYLLYVATILIFVSGSAAATRQSMPL
jgi:hypothetical protein